jgi:hypothetical protein
VDNFYIFEVSPSSLSDPPTQERRFCCCLISKYQRKETGSYVACANKKTSTRPIARQLCGGALSIEQAAVFLSFIDH